MPAPVQSAQAATEQVASRAQPAAVARKEGERPLASPAVRRRLKDLGIVHAVFGAHDKLAAAEPLLAQLGLSWAEVAVMGDDWPDLPLLVRAGLAVAPANAHAEVKAIAHHVSALRGGQGAARECCDLLLWATGRYADLLQGHLQTLDTTAPGARP